MRASLSRAENLRLLVRLGAVRGRTGVRAIGASRWVLGREFSLAQGFLNSNHGKKFPF